MTARDLKLNNDGDLDTTGGALSLVSDSDAILQATRIRLQFFRGEWFLDATQGLPYFDEIFVKNPQVPAVQALFRDEILNTPGVASVTSIELTYTPAERQLRVDFRATSDTGELLEGSV